MGTYVPRYVGDCPQKTLNTPEVSIAISTISTISTILITFSPRTPDGPLSAALVTSRR